MIGLGIMFGTWLMGYGAVKTAIWIPTVLLDKIYWGVKSKRAPAPIIRVRREMKWTIGPLDVIRESVATNRPIPTLMPGELAPEPNYMGYKCFEDFDGRQLEGMGLRVDSDGKLV
jgi:hypothetical protein